jgi:FKBP-type peptidyl-prolyl cis-trans isomerase FkpA
MFKGLVVSVLVLTFSNWAFADDGDLEKEKALSAAYVAEMAKEPSAEIIDEGVVLRPIYKSKSDVYPTVDSTVHVIYHLVNRDGQFIEGSIDADEDVSFPLNKLIKCWKVGIPKMSVGSLYKITCPSDAAYGDKGSKDGTIKGGMALTFRVALLAVE